MFTIHKQELKIKHLQSISAPKNSQIISVANQNNKLCAWYVCDSEQPNEEIKIMIVGTGHKLYDPMSPEAEPTNLTFKGTVIIDPYVWHVFAVSTEKMTRN